MQTQKVSAYELRNKLGEYLNLVYYKETEIIVEKMKKPVAKIVPVKEKSAPTKSPSSLLKYYGVFKTKKKYSIDEMEKIAKEGFIKGL